MARPALIRGAPPRRRAAWRRAALTLVASGAVLSPLPALAHDMPDELMLEVFVTPREEHVDVAVRLPLAFLLDTRMPKRGGGYIDFAEHEALDAALDTAVLDVADEVRLFQGGERLAVQGLRRRLSLPADTSFASYESAVASITGPPLPEHTNLFWNQGYFDAHLQYAAVDGDSGLALQIGAEPELARRVHVLVTYHAAGGETRSYDFIGTAGRVPLDAEWASAARLFAAAGWQRAVAAWEQLLWLLLVAFGVYAGTRPSFRVVAAALLPAVAVAAVPAVAVAVAQDRWVGALVASLVAASLLVLAIGNVFARELRWRWLTVAVAALAHGAALATGLDPVLQFRGDATAVALAAYAVAVAAALALAVLACLAGVALLRRSHGLARPATIVASVLVGHQAWHWLVERVGLLRALPAPQPDPETLLGLARGVVLALLLAAVAWLASEMVTARRRARPARAAGPSEAVPVPVGADAGNRDE